MSEPLAAVHGSGETGTPNEASSLNMHVFHICEWSYNGPAEYIFIKTSLPWPSPQAPGGCNLEDVAEREASAVDSHKHVRFTLSTLMHWNNITCTGWSFSCRTTCHRRRGACNIMFAERVFFKITSWWQEPMDLDTAVSQEDFLFCLRTAGFVSWKSDFLSRTFHLKSFESSKLKACQ